MHPIHWFQSFVAKYHVVATTYDTHTYYMDGHFTVILPMIMKKVYVTGFWKTDQNVTLYRPIPFYWSSWIATLIHYLFIVGVTGLSWLVCFSRVNFSDRVKSWLRWWGPWRALHGRHGSEIDPSGSQISLSPGFQELLYSSPSIIHPWLSEHLVIQTVLSHIPQSKYL